MGTTQYFDKWTQKHEISTMIHIPETHVLRYFTREDYNGKSAGIVLGAKNTYPLSKNDIYNEYCRSAGVPTKAFCFNGEISEDAGLLPGTQLHVGHFKPGQRLIASAKSIGYGWNDPMSRWHVGGGPKLDRGGFTRGRGAIASIGEGRVQPGTKMGGPVGNVWSESTDHRVLKINYLEQVIWIKGTVAGHINTWVILKDDFLKDRRTWTNEDPKLKDLSSMPLVPTDFRNCGDRDEFPAEEIASRYFRDVDEGPFEYNK